MYSLKAIVCIFHSCCFGGVIKKRNRRNSFLHNRNRKSRSRICFHFLSLFLRFKVFLPFQCRRIPSEVDPFTATLILIDQGNNHSWSCNFFLRFPQFLDINMFELQRGTHHQNRRCSLRWNSVAYWSCHGIRRWDHRSSWSS